MGRKRKEILTLKQLVGALEKCHTGDEEKDHAEAIGLLLDFIDSPEVDHAFHSIEEWYS